MQAPRLWPKSSVSASPSGMAALFAVVSEHYQGSTLAAFADRHVAMSGAPAPGREREQPTGPSLSPALVAGQKIEPPNDRG